MLKYVLALFLGVALLVFLTLHFVPPEVIQLSSYSRSSTSQQQRESTFSFPLSNSSSLLPLTPIALPLKTKIINPSKGFTPQREESLKSVIALTDIYLERSPSRGMEEMFFSPLFSMVGIHQVMTFNEKYSVNVQHRTTFNSSEYTDVGDAIIVLQGNCLANYHHGFMDTFVPWYHTVLSEGLGASIEKGEWPLMLLVPMGYNRWGKHNRACRSMNVWPYGAQHKLFWFYNGILNRSRQAWLYPTPGVLEAQRGYMAQHRDPRSLKLKFRRLIVGVNTSCHEDSLKVASTFPFYTTEVAHCTTLWQHTRETLLRINGVTDVDARVTQKELACPKILVLSRQGAKNGRSIDNKEEIMKVLRGMIPKCGEVKVAEMEKYTIQQQVQRMQWATSFVAPRGAGSINSLFLRHGAGFLSLSGISFTLQAGRGNDNMPWHPAVTLPIHHFTQFVLCPVTKCVRGFGSIVKINLCNMRCEEKVFRKEFETLQARMNGTGPSAKVLHVPQHDRKGGLVFYTAP